MVLYLQVFEEIGWTYTCILYHMYTCITVLFFGAKFGFFFN